MEPDKILDACSKLLKGKNPIFVINCVTLFLTCCLFFLFAYDVRVSNAIPLFSLSSKNGAILYNTTLGLLITTISFSICVRRLLLKFFLFLQKHFSTAPHKDDTRQDAPVTLTLFINEAIQLAASAVCLLFVYDELAHYSQNGLLRYYQGTIPVKYIITAITAYILWGIIQHLYFKLCNNHYKRFRYLSGTNYLDLENNEINVGDIVAYQGMKYEVVESKVNEAPSLFPCGKSAAISIPLDEAIKNGGVKIIRNR